MAFIRTIQDQTPPRRFDSTVFTKANIQESPTTGNPVWTTRSTITLSPVYTDALVPPSYDFTINTATLDPGLYRVLWEDAAGNKEAGDAWSSEGASSLSVIADSVKALMPLTWRALADAKYYGTDLLLSRIDVAKNLIFPSAVATAAESTYSKLMVEYVAKTAALEIIPAGIEYWMNQTTTISTSGTNEVVTYTDRANQLKELAKWLQAEVGRLAALPGLVTYLVPPGDQPEVADNTEDYVLTTSPYDFPPAFGDPTSSSALFGERD